MSDTDLRPRPTADRTPEVTPGGGGRSRRMLKFWLAVTGAILVTIAVVAAIGIGSTVDGQFRNPPSATLVWEYVLLMDAVALMAFAFGAAYLLETGRRANTSGPRDADTDTDTDSAR